MSETRLEELMELMMDEIQEDKMQHDSPITNEMIDSKLDVILELLHDHAECQGGLDDSTITLSIG